jgi:hypothetical protein
MAGLAHREAIAPWKHDPDRALVDYLRTGALTAPLVEGARQASQAIGLAGLRFFVRQAVGPGWALVGDAGLHLDPTPGLGITDALRDAIALADAVAAATDEALACYWHRRDADSIALYRMAADMGSGSYNSPFNRMVFRRSQRSPAMRARLLAVLDRECRPQEMLPLRRILGWLLSEALAGRLESFSGFRRMLRTALVLAREQQRFDRRARESERALSAPPSPPPAASAPCRDALAGSAGSLPQKP